MIEAIKEIQKLNATLFKMDEEALARLYMRVFNTDDGQLVLQDLANRCFIYAPTTNLFDEGNRSVILNIQARLSSVPTEEK